MARRDISLDDAHTLESEDILRVEQGQGLGLDVNGLAELRKQIAAWRAGPVAKSEARIPQRAPKLTTWSGIELPDLATPLDGSGDYATALGLPGQYPYTRGVQPTMYRSRLWTMRMFAGFGTAKQTNERFKYLYEQGLTGFSTAFDFPTLMGYDSDCPLAQGEVGKCGVAIDSVRDMDVLLADLPLDKVTVSMTINGPAIVLLAFYIALADERGIARTKLGGTVQNDCLKEFIAQHAWLVPPRPAMRLVTDMIEFCARELPRWNTVSISGYHIREAGSTAAQELAFTLADGLAYVTHCLERGMDVDAFAPRLSFFFDVHNDFFEEIAKFRAARRMWARFMKERFGAKRDTSLKLRTHAQTAGVALTAQQPYNNVARVALQGLAAVLGGTQSLHTNSLDETYALPTAEAATIALRTQQIIAHESGVANTIDPLGGSYFVEWLTDRLEAEAMSYIERIDDMGGMVAAIEKGYPQREIAASAYEFQRALETGQRVMVGINQFQMDDEAGAVPTLKIDESVQKSQNENLTKLKADRDDGAVAETLGAVRAAAATTDNLMPPIIAAASAQATEQEICDVLREVLGNHTDRPEF